MGRAVSDIEVVEEDEGEEEIENKVDLSGQQIDGGGRVVNFMVADEADSFEEKINRGGNKGTTGALDKVRQDINPPNNTIDDIEAPIYVAIAAGEKVELGERQRTGGDSMGKNTASVSKFGSFGEGWSSTMRERDGVKHSDLKDGSMSDGVENEQGMHHGGGKVGQEQEREGDHDRGDPSWQVLAAGGVSGVTLVTILIGLIIWGRCKLERDRVKKEKKSVNQMQAGGVDLDSVSLDSGDLEVVSNMHAAINANIGSLKNGMRHEESLNENNLSKIHIKPCKTEYTANPTVGHVSDNASGDSRGPRKNIHHPSETSISQLDDFLSTLSPTCSPSETQRLSTSGESDRLPFHLR